MLPALTFFSFAHSNISDKLANIRRFSASNGLSSGLSYLIFSNKIFKYPNAFSHLQRVLLFSKVMSSDIGGYSMKE